MKIGIPRCLFYYHYGWMWCEFFKNLNIKVVLSKKTDKDIINRGNKYASDEMCLSLKTLIGHVDYLKDKCDYILIPRIDNYGLENQTCTNFLASYDIINNLFNINILNYNIDYMKYQTEMKAYLKLGFELGFEKHEIDQAYVLAKYSTNKILDLEYKKNKEKLASKRVKILIVSHPYNVYDNYIGEPIISYLKQSNIEIIYSDKFKRSLTNRLASTFSNSLYWKYSKENIGSIKLVETKIDGIIFLTTFPCGLDSIVNELVIRRTNLPVLNLIVDDLDSIAGLETRIESFIDILDEKAKQI